MDALVETRTERRRLGDEAEEAAVRHLTREGHVVLARNVSCRHGELDLITQKEGVVCFVEVRMRSRPVFGDPASTVTGEKQRRVVKTAMHFLQRNRVDATSLRFDVVSVTGRGRDALVEHIPNAFDAGF